MYIYIYIYMYIYIYIYVIQRPKTDLLVNDTDRASIMSG